jgi:hypothetical protein
MATVHPSAFHFFAVDHPAVAGTVRARLEKYRRELIEGLSGAPSWDSFKERVGKLQGIDDAIQYCLDVENEATERNK